MLELSIVIITYNEEKNIAKCLEALHDISDDIIVLDSFSSDGTMEICKSYPNVNFIQRKWEGYSKTKNFANGLTKYDYILSVDADEVLSTELRQSIFQLKKFSGAYEFSRLTNYCGKWIKHCGWYPDKKIRIFHKAEAHWEGDFVHEELVLNTQIPVQLLAGDLHHYSYHSLQDHYNQIEKYSSLHAQKMMQNNAKASLSKRYISPVFKFIKTYFLQLGLLDGKSGFTIARISAKAVKLKYRKLKMLRNG